MRDKEIIEEVLKPAARLGLTDEEYAEFIAFLESLPEPAKR